MTDSVSDNTMASSSLPDISSGAVNQVGSQMDSPLSLHSNVGGIGGLDVDNHDKDIFSSAPVLHAVSVAVPPNVPVADPVFNPVGDSVTGSATIPSPVPVAAIVSAPVAIPPLDLIPAKRRRYQIRLPRLSLLQRRRNRLRLYQNTFHQHRRCQRGHRQNRLDASPTAASGTASPQTESLILQVPRRRTTSLFLEVPLTSYQASDSGTAYYHPERISYYRHPLVPNGFIGTLSEARFHSQLPQIATAELLQNDLYEAQIMARLADSVNAPGIFTDGADNYLDLEEVEWKRHEERRIAAGVHLRIPHDAVRIGSHYVPILDRPSLGVLPDNAHPVSFLSAYFVACGRGDVADGTESLIVGPGSGDIGDVQSPFDEDSLRFDAASPPSDAGSISDSTGSFSDDAASVFSDVESLPGDASFRSGDATSLSSGADSLRGDFDSMLGEAGSLPSEADAELDGSDALLDHAASEPGVLSLEDGEGNDVHFIWQFRDMF